MPVTWVLHWQPNQGAIVSNQILSEATQCVESLNGVKEGPWKATLHYHKPILREQSHLAEYPREFLRVAFHDEPSKSYYVIRSQKVVVEADSSFQLIMERLQSYESRLSFNFEGFKYQLGDFRLRVGKVTPTHSQIVRGIIMEVEYLPISSMENARKVMKEFMDIWLGELSKKSLPGKFVNVEPNFGMFDLGDNYTPQHTVVRYAFFMANVMAMIQAGMA